MKSVRILNRLTGELLFELSSTSGLVDRDVLELAVKCEANLSEANLSGADLRYADLSGVNLSCADLSGADLSGADLRGADLSEADLSGADLRGADLSEADLRGADLSGADCDRADGAQLENLKEVAKIALSTGLQMHSVHSGCGTTHCIAGWACAMLPNGKLLEQKLGWEEAGRLLLGNDAASHFFDSDEQGRAFLKQFVEQSA